MAHIDLRLCAVARYLLAAQYALAGSAFDESVQAIARFDADGGNVWAKLVPGAYLRDALLAPDDQQQPVHAAIGLPLGPYERRPCNSRAGQQ